MLRKQWVVRRLGLVAGLGLVTWSGMPQRAQAHCDSLGGPVLNDAKQALDEGRPDRVLKWVRPADEAEVTAAFADARALVGAGDDARRVGELRFFETLVRVHRAGEGAPYTGLRAADDVEPAARLADAALAEGNVDELARRLAREVEESVRERYAKVRQLHEHADHNVEAGRAYVAAYVDYVHHVEGVHRAAEGPVGHGAAHEAGVPAAAAHQHE